MIQDTKTQFVILLLVASAGFAFGSWSVKSTTDVKTTTQQSNATQDKNSHTRITVTDVRTKDGTETKTVVADRVSNDVSIDTTSMQTQQTHVTTGKTSTVNISLLGAEDFAQGFIKPTYGLSVSKEILGPVTVGAFGFMNGTVGVSIGLDF
jgi:hypothetical protein